MNIAKLIPYLLNKITKVESDLSNIGSDFDPTTLATNTEYFYEPFLYRGIGNVSSVTSALYSNIIPNINTLIGSSPSFTVELAVIGDTNIYKPCIKVLGSSAGGYLATYMGLSPSLPYLNFIYGSNLELTYKTTFSINNYLTDRVYEVGFGTTTQSSSVLGGWGVYLKFSQNNNSGNVQLCQINSGVVTAVNTSTSLTANTRYALEVVFNTSTNIAVFYLNGTLLGQITVGSLINKTVSPFYHIQSLSAIQTTASSLYIHNLFMQIKYL